MSTVNVGSALPAGTNTIGNIKIVDTGGTNQAAIDANNNLHVALYQAANSMGIDASNNAHVGLWNGTNQAAIDSNGNQSVKGNSAEQSGLSAGALNADLVASTDVSAYKWFSIQLSAIATGGVLTFQGSNDNSNWTSVFAYRIDTPGYTLGGSSSSSLGIYAGAIQFRYLRIRQTAWTSGSSTGTLELYTVAPSVQIANVQAAQYSTWTVQPGNTANTTPWLATINQGSNSATVTASNALKVDGSAVTQPVSGTVTANAGTNLNTSLLALETGGNLATLAGAVTSAKVQTNVSQINGVAPTMGNGVTGTGVQRVTISSDSTGQVTLATGANTIGAVTQASGPWTNNITQVGGSAVTLGSKTSANSIPVVIASDQGALPMTNLNVVDAANSSTANLGSNAVFTGTGTSALNYSALSIEIFANQASAAGGLSIQQSQDNVNWDLADTFSVSASVAFSTSVNVVGQYYRVVYTNGASAQTTFRLQTIRMALEDVLPRTLTAGGNLRVDGSAVTQPVSGTVTANAGTGNFTVVQATGTNLHIVNDAGSAVIGSVTLQATSGTALVADQTNSELRVSTYVKTTTAGDTALTLGQTTMAASLPVTLASNQGNINVVQVAATTGGSTPSHTMSAASTNATSLKASAGIVYGFCISNVNAAARFVKFYNKASAPTVGTDTPITTVQVPANGTVIRAYPVGITFSTGIAWAATGLITNADTTAIGANDLSIDIDYL